MHGGYARTVADGAAGGRPLLIALAVRRFRCLQDQCPAVTFAEQAGGLTERYRRLMALTGSPQCCSANLPSLTELYITRLVMCSHGLCRRVVVVS